MNSAIFAQNAEELMIHLEQRHHLWFIFLVICHCNL